MNDRTLIEFLLRSDFFENQLKVDEKIRIAPKGLALGTPFFKELEKTERKYTVISGEVQFECHDINQPNLQIAQ